MIRIQELMLIFLDYYTGNEIKDYLSSISLLPNFLSIGYTTVKLIAAWEKRCNATKYIKHFWSTTKNIYTRYWYHQERFSRKSPAGQNIDLRQTNKAKTLTLVGSASTLTFDLDDGPGISTAERRTAAQLEGNNDHTGSTVSHRAIAWRLSS